MSVLLPDRKFNGLWHRILHDRTADAIAEEVSRLPHANVTTVPFHFDIVDDPGLALPLMVGARGDGAGLSAGDPPWAAPGPARPGHDGGGGNGHGPPAGCTPIADVRYRQRARVGGRVRSLRVVPQHDAPLLELVLDDGTAAISVVFLGRRGMAGVEVGRRMVVEGTVGVHRNRLALLNPGYSLQL